ncbi:sulfotransferase domain-containing protein [Nocardioides sp. GY 10113]|uniref:sulfotransferase family protein n=1 Tax=Nocardioides sp. GY 10113 TaxID=2569761 RepID=UPI0010A88979|nr:sulfotransferase domain-containing protein [Nocardioides sp. GY 10113]TIC81542.1 sulfotransferase domain-containing protein [Nocardioides sp. GY 10113]
MSSNDQSPARSGSPSRLDDGMPSFAVIGAQKSASTFLQDQMSLHPEIEIPDGEVRHFEDPFYSAGEVARLPELFERPAATTVRGIKRPDYLGRPEIPARIQAAMPDARLLVVLRDPIARAVSSYFHFARHGFVPLLPIDDAVQALMSGAWESDYPRAPEVLTFGRYGEHLERYLGLFPAEQMMVFEQVHLIRRSPEALRAAFEFVGVDPEWRLPEGELRVSNKGVYSLPRLRLLRTKNRTRFTYTESMDRRYPRRMTPWGWTYNASVVGLDRLVLSHFDSGRPPELAVETRAALEEYYASDRDVLRRLLPCWGVEPDWL